MNLLTKMNFVVGACVIALTFYEACAGPLTALIPFQCQLTDQQGRPYTNGVYTLQFAIYDQAVSGSPLWTERHAAVTNSSGRIQVLLGSLTNLDTIDFSDTKFLGITIDEDNNPNTPDPEMVPRQIIVPGFFTKESSDAGALQGFDWSTLFDNGNPVTGKILGSRIAASSVGASQLQANSIGASQLGEGAVTLDKLAPNVIRDSLAVGGDAGLPSGTILVCQDPDSVALKALGYVSLPDRVVAASGKTFYLYQLP